MRKMDGIEHCYNMMKAVETDFPVLKNAAECRYYSTVCNILFQIKDDKHESMRQALWNEVLKYRKMFCLMPKQEKGENSSSDLLYGI